MGDICIVATGERWVGYGIRSFSSVTKELMDSAKKELLMTVYVLTDTNTVSNIRGALERGVSVEIFIYSPDSFQKNQAVDEILRLEEEYDYLRIHRIEDKILHAKVLITDNRKILTGSANLTFGGMVRNYELGFLVEDAKIAQKAIRLLRRLEVK